MTTPESREFAELPLSFAQERLWFLDRLVPGSAAYNVPVAIELAGDLDRALWARALGEARRRHEALRTTFAETPDGAVQRIATPDAAALPLPEVDLTALPASIRRREADRLVDVVVRQPFDLVRGPLLRAALLALGGGPDPAGPVIALVSVHHIVADGWSVSVLLDEVAQLYAAFARGQPSPLPPLALQYGDYAVWQRQWLTPEILAEPLAHFDAVLAGVPPVLALPTDRPRPAVQSFRGRRREIHLPAGLIAGLGRLGREVGATPFMTLLAALAALLHRLSGAGAIPIGLPVAGRGRTELEDLVGLFVNTVVVCPRMAPGETFRQLLARVRDEALAAYAREHLPFEKLVEARKAGSSLSHNPIFQVLFGYHVEATDPPCFAGLESRLLDYDLGAAHTDLALSAEPEDGGLRASLELSTDLFDPATGARLLAGWRVLLAGTVEDAARRVAELPLLGAAERHQLLAEWNDTARGSDELPLDRLERLFERQAAAAPERVAIEEAGAGAGGAVTYGELDRRAGAVAGALRRLGIGPETTVAILLPRGAEAVAAILGALKAGGAYLPLDPAYPRERLAAMLADALRPTLVTRRGLDVQLDLAAEAGAVVFLDDLATGDAGKPAPEPAPAPGLRPPATIDSLAYVLYTSGSTGRPKGVGCGHRGAANVLAEMARRRPLAAGHGASLWTSLSFDVSVYEIFAPLASGGRLEIAPDAVRPDAAALLRWIEERRIESAYLPPFALPELARRLETGGGTPLARLLVGVEPIPEPLLARIARLAPGLAVINGYGPTEATICCTLHAVDPRAAGSGTTPVGRPLPETRIHLLDRDLQPVPLGMPGELCVAGWGLARGYLGRPEATAERFLPDPFSGLDGARPGERLYRTGDLVRRRTDGTCEFLGRIDHQIKLRGFRIEPEEVEAALATHPAVAAAAVARRDDGPAGGRLGAYVVLAAGATAAPADLAEHLRARLPAHLVPVEWTAVEALPVTPQGKLDRRALPRAVPRRWPAGARAAASYVAPRTPIEAALAAVWAELLGNARVGVHDDFFAAGGHSLLAAQAAARVREVLAVELPTAALFAAPTPASLGRWIERTVEAPAPAPPPALAPRARLSSLAPDAPDLPLSLAQERLWLVDQLKPGATYNLPFVLELAGPLDAAAWAAAIAAVRRRHEALRTRFRAVSQASEGRGREGRAAQVIDPAGSPFPGTPLVDLSGLAGPLRAAEEARRTAEEARRPFDLASGPLLRSALLRLAPAEHRALLSFHHIVFDGWSIGVLLAELEALYGVFAAGTAPTLPALSLQYADYALWQRRWLGGEVLESQLAYWRERLAGDLTFELPADRLRPSRQARGEIRGGELQAALPAALAERLARLGRDAGATPFMTFLAAFATLLHRLTGRDAIALGAPVANRDRPEVAGLIGFFVNTLVLVADVSGDPSFAALLARVREAALGAYAHQDLPFDRLVAELRPERRLDDNPLLRVVFSFHRPLPRLAAGGLRGTARQVHNGTAKFDLLLALTEEDRGLAGAWEYRADLFDRSTVGRFAAGFAHLLADAEAHPERPVSRLDLLDEAARHQLTREWNDTGAEFPRRATLAERFARQAARAPEQAALLGPAAGEEMSYGELDRRSTALARRLAARGVGPEVRVALLLGRSVDLIVAILATVKAGGAYVPLDPAYPTARLVFMLGDSRAAVLVTHRGLAARLGTTGLSTLDLDGDLDVDPEVDSDAGPDVDSDIGPGSAAAADNLAYVMYTSGSTGRPKGVGATHRNVIRLVEGASYVRFGPEQVFLQLAPPSFDASTLEIWGPLLHGGRLAIAAEGRASLAELSAMIREHGITTLWLTTGLFHQMVDEELAGLAPLAQLMTGGDALSPQRARAALARLSTTALVNFYGPTEGTTFASSEPLREGGAPGAAVPIGRPIDNARIVVLDQNLARVPIGVPGELYVGGDGVARGYLDRPELTAERFLPDPWPDAAGERLYRTGDRVRRLADGRIDFLGRTDAQVKIAGQRIEPGEVETALARHPRVLQCAVAVEGEGADDKRLVAFAVVDAEADADASHDREALRIGPRSLRAWLAERLPEAMVPARVLLLDALPQNANGKIDRPAVQRLAAGHEEGRAEGEAPPPVHDPLVELLLGIFAEVLGRERVGVDDSFFDLGGHSLLGTRLVARVRHLCGVDLSLRALFEEPTVAGLAAQIAAAHGGPPPLPLTAAPRPRQRSHLAPASLAQRRLWFLQRLAPAGFFLNVPHALRLRGDLAAPILARCLTEIAARHEPLRTTFAVEDGQPMQRIAPASPVALPSVDLTRLPAPREREARRLARSMAERPFDPAVGPLLRALLLRLGPADHLLVLVPHHLVFDGWSMGVLFRELAELYGAFGEGRPSPLAPLPVAYSDFASWQRRALAGEVRERQLEYWRERLAGLPALDLPTDRPRPPVPPFRGGVVASALSPTLAAALAALCRRQGVTLFMALLAAWELVLAHLSGQRDFPVGVPVAGRSRPEVEELIGFFVNTLVLRADLGGEPRLAELLARTREAALGAYAHQDLPFEELVLALKPERHAAVNPLFDVALSLDEAPAPAALPGLSAEPFDFASDIAHFELTLVASRAPAARGGGVTLALNYRRDLFDRTTAARLVEGLVSLLAAAVAAPESPALALPVCSEAARHQVLHEWSVGSEAGSEVASEAEGAPASAETVDRRVARAAARAPRALAVGGHGGSLTYGELAGRAARLGSRLRRAGVGPGRRVALVLDRSPELALAALAVLAAGAAYLPLDPGLPAARLAEIVADSAAAAIVARGATLGRLAGCLAGGLAGCAARLLAVEEAGCEGETAEPAPAPHGPGDLAYVIYTSGSTGRPKGVELTHGGLANLVAWHGERYAVTAADRAAWVANPAFDASIWELWPYLAAGASIHLPPPEVAGSPRELLAWLAETGITLAFLPTPLAEAVLRLPHPPGLRLRALLTGGDRLRQAPPADLGFSLVNHYGPTESTVVATAGNVAPAGPLADPAAPSIGRPIAGLAVHLLDSDLRPTPLGGRGEICLGGRGLARGYLGLPALTAERFIPHPFAEHPGARLYRTGDLARLLADGRIDFLGRSDSQVKVRGFRVELGEIEARLAVHPEVREAAVVVDPSPTGDRLVACVVPRSAGAGPLTPAPPAPPAAPALRDHLRATLPSYMVPALFVSVDVLPLTSRGKLDRAALLELALASAGRAEPSAAAEPAAIGADAPNGRIELVLAGIWRQVLKLPDDSARLGAEDNFFDLGGQSLALVAVHERLEAELGIELPLVELFEHTTIRSLAARLAGPESAALAPEELGGLTERAERAARAERQRNAPAWKERARQARRQPDGGRTP